MPSTSQTYCLWKKTETQESESHGEGKRMGKNALGINGDRREFNDGINLLFQETYVKR